MSVAVISSTGKVLMPTSEYRARKLLKSGMRRRRLTVGQGGTGSVTVRRVLITDAGIGKINGCLHLWNIKKISMSSRSNGSVR